mmetsp:Transcript_25643/g.102245  ORF Transcript_25643/g.102245 Transcript_25643/m.102245 type:complete len:206 (-) Transcript_25643:1994-2611(-)
MTATTASGDLTLYEEVPPLLLDAAASSLESSSRQACCRSPCEAAGEAMVVVVAWESCACHMAAYSPSGRARRSWCVPYSATRPSRSTRIASASTMVERRCAMAIEVRAAASSLSARWMARSVRESSADVASSSSTTGGFLTKSRAMATRCFSPPDSLSPRSPTIVSKPCSSDDTKSQSSARFAARSTTSRAAGSSTPRPRLSGSA